MDGKLDLNQQNLTCAKKTEQNCTTTRLNLKTEKSKKKSPDMTPNSDNKFDLPSFKCTECSYQSIWKHAVKRHQQTHFKDIESCESIKRDKFQCEHCSTTLESWGEFKAHQTIHITSNQLLQKSKRRRLVKCDSNKNKPVFGSTRRTLPIKGANNSAKLATPKRPYKRGKYANVPIKTTKNGLFECQHCSYQTAIRTALVKHQTNHVNTTD